jgi:hypothetical protein
MTEAPPIICRWDGEAFVPAGRFARIADQHYVVGETYRLVEHQDRSAKSHKHFFAEINEAWQSLPERYAGQPWAQSPEHLRRYALIKAGFCDAQTFVASSRAEAIRLAAFLRPVDEYAIVTTEGATVTRYTAKSQSMRAMGKRVFQESKTAVLDVLADMLDVTPGALAENAGQAA